MLLALAGSGRRSMPPRRARKANRRAAGCAAAYPSERRAPEVWHLGPLARRTPRFAPEAVGRTRPTQAPRALPQPSPTGRRSGWQRLPRCQAAERSSANPSNVPPLWRRSLTTMASRPAGRAGSASQAKAASRVLGLDPRNGPSGLPPTPFHSRPFELAAPRAAARPRNHAGLLPCWARAGASVSRPHAPPPADFNQPEAFQAPSPGLSRKGSKWRFA